MAGNTMVHGAPLLRISAALPQWPTSIFTTPSTPAHAVHQLSLFVLTITCGIFVSISALLIYVLVKYRCRPDDHEEPPQVFGSMQIELAWTIIPILLIVVLFLGTARIIFAVEDAPKPASALDVIVIGHQFWWEFRYPKYHVVTANELHVPISDPKSPTPTYMQLTSADVMHSFWVPELAGKTDVLPNRVNNMWIDPHITGLFLGQCAQFCGPEHAKMLLRVYVDTPQQFQAWIADQQRLQESGTPNLTNVGAETNLQPPTATAHRPSMQTNPSPARSAVGDDAITPEAGRRVFEEQACINCHTIAGTVADGRYGPDLTHLMSRDTIASGVLANTRENLLKWITDPAFAKPGTTMPAMHLTPRENEQILAYLTTLH